MKTMKTTILFGGLLALATSMKAESTLITVNVPFEFVAGSNVMPAGNYTIQEPTATHGVLLLHGTAPNSIALVLATNAGPCDSDQAGVKFSRRGTAVVLSTIDVPGGSKYAIVAPEPKAAVAMKVALPRK
jgi:hypothetical protein